MPHKIPFRVVHVSSEDENYPANELNHHSPATRGWASFRFCTYPQRVVLALDDRVRLCKIQVLCHQYLIASKVEFFVGDASDDIKPQVQNAQYTRLGYVSLSDNESTKFKARELKSVHVDAVGNCVQLLLHRNHANKYNIYNQVGLIAVNFIGDPMSDSSQGTQKTSVSRRPDFIPPTEDLAFAIYQDPEVAEIIRHLEKVKLAHVTDEQFDEAQKIRNTIGELQRVGERLGRLALEKQQAVEEENYERAKLKKYQIHEIRQNLYRDPDLVKLLPDPVFQRHDQVLKSRMNETDPQSINHSGVGNVAPSPPSSARSVSNEDRPLPALKHRSRNNNAVPNASPTTMVTSSTVSGKDSASPDDPESKSGDKSLGSGNGRISEYAEEGSFGATEDDTTHSDQPNIPEVLSETNRRLATLAIDVVGLELVTNLFSKSWMRRQKALKELEKRVCSDPLPAPVSAPGNAGPDPQAELRSTAFLLQRCLQDQVLSIFRLATGLIKSTVVDFCDHHSVPRVEFYHAIEKLLSILVNRTGDHSARIRELAKSHILLMAEWPQIRQCPPFWHEVTRPFSTVTLDRLASSRMELVTELYALLGSEHTEHNGLTVDSLVTFTANALNHRSNEVRDAAENLMVALYRAEDRTLVRRILPPNDLNTQKQLLYRRLFAKFDRIDEKFAPVGSVAPAPVEAVQESNVLRTDGRRTVAPPNHRKSKPVPNNPISQPKATRKSLAQQASKQANQKVPAGKANLSRSTERRTPISPPPPPMHRSFSQSTGDPDLLLNLDKTCIFCGGQSEEFTEEGLDLHYWKDCPMLHQCVNCKQVVEIASLYEHLLSECEAAASYVRCDRCTQAMRKTKLRTHPCVPAATCSVRCPLCHTDLSLTDPASGLPCAAEDVWRAHLIGSNANIVPVCTKNPRRPPPPQQAVHIGSRQSKIVSKPESKMTVPRKEADPHPTLIPRPTDPVRSS